MKQQKHQRSTRFREILEAKILFNKIHGQVFSVCEFFRCVSFRIRPSHVFRHSLYFDLEKLGGTNCICHVWGDGWPCCIGIKSRLFETKSRRVECGKSRRFRTKLGVACLNVMFYRSGIGGMFIYLYYIHCHGRDRILKIRYTGLR